jgi:cold shock CspA family protein
MEGRVKIYKPTQGYGFLKIEDEYGRTINGCEFFFLDANVRPNVRGAHIMIGQSIQPGDRVSFWLDDNPRNGGWMAVEISVTGPSAPRTPAAGAAGAAGASGMRTSDQIDAA